MLLAMLLFQICIWLYQKIDYSKSGWFYFNLPKYFFIACVCLLPISAVTANMVALELPSIGLLLLSIGLVLAFNYLAASHNQRKNVGKILLESGKTIVVGCALVFVVLNYEPILCAVEYLLWVNTDAVDGQWETYESTEFVDWVQDEYKGEQACKDGLAEIRNQGIETLIPDEMEQWKFREAIVNWTVRGTSPEKKYDGYAMRLGNDNKDRVFLYCTRMNDKAKPNQIMSCIEGLRVIKDEEYGTLIVTSYTADDKTQFISFCQYYEGKEYYDSYTVTGEVPEEELLTIVHSLK